MANKRVISAVLTLKDKDFGTTAQKSAKEMKALERSTKHATNNVSRFGKTATSSFKSVVNSALGLSAAIGLTAAVSGGFNMIRGSVDSALKRIDTMESFERVLTTLTGSTEKTAKALDVTRDAVTGTAYGMDVAAKSVQDFVTRGMDVEKATSTLAAWGDAVAFYGDGSNEQLGGVMDALAKMYSTGKVSMDQMNRLYDAGIDGVGTYAKATKSSVVQVQKDLSSGKINAEQFIDVVSTAMMEGTNGVVKIAGAAKEAGASWGASFDNMKAAVGRGTMEIIQSIDKMLVDNGLPDMRSMVASFGKKFESVLKEVAEKVPVVADKVMGMYETIRPGLDWIKDVAFPGISAAVDVAIGVFQDIYNFTVNNLPLIVPVIGGIVAMMATFKLGTMMVTGAMTLWKTITSGVQIATMILNGTLAVSPLGWLALAIGVVVAAGIALWQNWDTVKEAAQSLWDKVKIVGVGIETAFTAAFSAVQRAAASAMNYVIERINDLIGVINKIPGVNVPIVAKVDWGNAQQGPSGPQKSGSAVGALASYAVGTNRVPHDMVAQIHKDEMIVPATQSENLRRQGVTIDNIDTPVPRTTVRPSTVNTGGGGNDLSALISAIMQLIQLLSQNNGQPVVNINARDKSATEIVNELIPILLMRMANI